MRIRTRTLGIVGAVLGTFSIVTGVLLPDTGLFLAAAAILLAGIGHLRDQREGRTTTAVYLALTAGLGGVLVGFLGG
jgi:hypothetical protein